MSATRKIDIIDTSCIFQDDGDNSKRMRFELEDITPSETRIMRIPDANTTLAGIDITQIITNKSIDADNNTVTNIDNSCIKSSANIDASKIADGSVSNTEFQYLMSLGSAAVGTTDAQTLTNKTFTDSLTYFQDDTDNTKKFRFQISSITSGNTRVFSLPDGNTTIVGTNIAQTLTNKTLTSPIISSISNTGTLTLPTSTDTLVGRDTTDTLTNKTLTTPTIQTNLILSSSYLEIEDISAPSNPGAGKGRLYKKTGDDGIFWKPDIAGSEVDLTSTTGSASARFDAFYDPLVETIVTTLWTDVPLNTERVKDSEFTHSADSAEITINTTNSYLIIARCTTYLTSSSNMGQTQLRLVVDTGSGYSQIDGTIGAMYNRNKSDGQNTANVSLILTLNSGDKIKMQSIKISGNSIVSLLSEGSSITMTKV